MLVSCHIMYAVLQCESSSEMKMKAVLQVHRVTVKMKRLESSSEVKLEAAVLVSCHIKYTLL
jgi:hypothetical protein